MVLVEASSGKPEKPIQLACLTHRKTYTFQTSVYILIGGSKVKAPVFDDSAEDKEMILKLVSEMPGGFEAMNGYLRRNIAEALRTMQAWDLVGYRMDIVE